MAPTEHISVKFRILVFTKIDITIPILVKIGKNNKLFTRRRKYIYDLSPLLLFITEMDCALVTYELRLEKPLSLDYDEL